jgi:hypothetical protein
VPGRAPKHCGKPGCTTPVKGAVYCTEHEALRQARMASKRPNTTQRGYDHHHDQARAAWAPVVAQGGVSCRRCHQLITPGQAWDLGHDDNDRTLPPLPEHARACNRAAAGATTTRRRVS